MVAPVGRAIASVFYSLLEASIIDSLLTSKVGHGAQMLHRFKMEPLTAAIVIGELIDEIVDAGRPDFYALQFHCDRGLCVWAIDLLHQNGRDLRELPLLERKPRLEKLIVSASANWLRYSESFDDGLKLLAEADRLGLEGIVSKLKFRRRQFGWRSPTGESPVRVRP
jgi:ATP-dependent DNA ligase